MQKSKNSSHASDLVHDDLPEEDDEIQTEDDLDKPVEFDEEYSDVLECDEEVVYEEHVLECVPIPGPLPLEEVEHSAVNEDKDEEDQNKNSVQEKAETPDFVEVDDFEFPTENRFFRSFTPSAFQATRAHGKSKSSGQASGPASCPESSQELGKASGRASGRASGQASGRASGRALKRASSRLLHSILRISGRNQSKKNSDSKETPQVVKS